MIIWAKLTENFVNSQYYSKIEIRKIMEDWRDKLGAAFGAELEQLEAEKAAAHLVATQVFRLGVSPVGIAAVGVAPYRVVDAGAVEIVLPHQFPVRATARAKSQRNAEAE